MKAVTIALLLANLLLFGWLYSHPQSHRPGVMNQVDSFPASVEPLVLLRERTKDSASQTESDTGSTGRELPPELPAPQATNERVDLESAPAVPAMQTPEPSQAADSPEGSEAIPGTMESGVTPASTGSTSETAPERICQTIGPFSSRNRAEEFVSELAGPGREPAVRASQIEQPSGYWVYLPSMPVDDARRIIDDLSAKGVRDYFLGRQNFISLGMFSDKRSAETRVNEISALGYTPRLEPRYLTREVFWVDLEERVPQIIEEPQWSELLKDLAEIRRQSVACE